MCVILHMKKTLKTVSFFTKCLSIREVTELLYTVEFPVGRPISCLALLALPVHFLHSPSSSQFEQMSGGSMSDSGI